MPPASESVEAVSVPVLPLASGVGEVLRLPPVKPALDDPCAPLRALLQQYMTPEEVARVREAYELALAAHGEQTRRSGEPYIHHPVAVACILAELQLDIFTVQAALLHDVIEDCGWDDDGFGMLALACAKPAETRRDWERLYAQYHRRPACPLEQPLAAEAKALAPLYPATRPQGKSHTSLMMGHPK